MTHYTSYLEDGKFLAVKDFTKEGREVTVSRVAREKMPAREDDPEVMAQVIYILAADGTEYPRPYKVPKMMFHGMAYDLGTDCDLWTGKRIVIYVTKCSGFGEIEECLRVILTPLSEAKLIRLMKRRRIKVACYRIFD